MSFWERNNDGLQCNAPMGSTGFNLKESLSVISDLCKIVPQQRIGLNNGFSTLKKTALGNSNMRISITYPSSACDEATAKTLTINQAACEQAFYCILDGCAPASNGNLGFYGGNVPSGCATFSISAEAEEVVRCGGNPSSRATDMRTEDIEKAIDEYCALSLELSPAPQQISNFIMTTPTGQSYNNYLSAGNLIRTKAQFSDQAQQNCVESQAFNTKGDECRRKLTAVKDQCGGQGGGLSENGVNGCVVWTMWGESLK